MLDLTTQNTVQTSYSENLSDGTITVSFTDAANLSLGTLRIETPRFRALAEALVTVARELYPDGNGQPGYSKTQIFLQQKQATTTFS